jgi:stearoyl-CoA desaturase (Delta-9 desaturase)
MVQHTFPHDYRSGPAKSDWDPSKWVILALAKVGFAWGLRCASAEDIAAARAQMLAHERDHSGAYKTAVEEEWVGPTWTEAELEEYVKESGACIILLDEYAVDVTGYIDVHVRFSLSFHFGIRSLVQPGGARLLRNYAFPINPGEENDRWKEAGRAFNGGVNNHSQAARRRMRQLRVARVL